MRKKREDPLAENREIRQKREGLETKKVEPSSHPIDTHSHNHKHTHLTRTP